MPEKIAEVIESSTRQFVAEVYRETDPPAFGTWVRVPHDRGITLFGLVSHVEIRSLEPNRQARALGKTLEELRREYPQIPDLLTTTFRAQVIAYADADGQVRQTLPPHPAGVHDFVFPGTPDDVEQLGRPFDFLRTLVSSPDPSVPVDDLLVAVLSNLHTAHGRALSRLLDDDHERLQSILRRIG
ncbi:MAG: hypothetical protein GVY18_03390 [Bacteroidetes bacterium]|jgi:hypothetical protein|nr:hypothetical protein [Bacteroidota bacterium]